MFPILSLILKEYFYNNRLKCSSLAKTTFLSLSSPILKSGQNDQLHERATLFGLSRGPFFLKKKGHFDIKNFGQNINCKRSGITN